MGLHRRLRLVQGELRIQQNLRLSRLKHWSLAEAAVVSNPLQSLVSRRKDRSLVHAAFDERRSRGHAIRSPFWLCELVSQLTHPLLASDRRVPVFRKAAL